MKGCYHIFAESVGDAWIQYLEVTLTQGYAYFDEEDQLTELSDIFLRIEKRAIPDPILDTFCNPQLLALFLKKIQLQEIIPEFNSSYGKRLFDQTGIDQIAWLIQRLKHKPETKAATISLLLPNDPGPRIPCLTLIDCKIRNQRLHLFAHFRSQDVYRAYGNFNALFWLHEYICSRVSIDAGALKIFCSSAHLYEKNLQDATAILRSFHQQTHRSSQDNYHGTTTPFQHG